MAPCSFWTSIFVVALLCAGNLASSEVWVHLTADSGSPWGGECSAECVESFPCSPINPRIRLHGICQLKFMGDWAARTVEFVSNGTGPTHITASSDARYLDLSLSVAGPLTVGNDSAAASFSDFRFKVNIMGSSVQAVTLANLLLRNTSFEIVGDYSSSIHVDNVRLLNASGLDTAFIKSNLSQVPTLKLTRLEVYNNASLHTLLDFKAEIESFELLHCSLVLEQLLSNVTIVSGSFVDTNISVVPSSNHLMTLQGDEPESFSLIQSRIIGDNGPVTFANRDIPINISSSVMENVAFAMKSTSNLRLAVIDETLWLNCRVSVSGLRLQFINSQLNFTSPGSSLALNGNPSKPLKLDTDRLRISAGNGQVQMTDGIVFTPNSNLEIDRFQIVGGFIDLSTIIVTQEMILSNVRVRTAQDAKATWTFYPNSIVSDNPTLSSITFTDLYMLHYIASPGSTGITNATFGTAGEPTSVLVTWHGNVPPSLNTAYKIISLDTSNSNHSRTYATSPASSPYIFEPFIESHNLQFRYLGSSQQIQCPLPIPEHFICDHGVLVAPTDVTSPTITLPAGSGSVYVNGSLTVSNSLIFGGLGTQLNVTGCVFAQNGITIDLTKTQKLPEGEVTLISQSSECNQSLTSISLQTKSDDKNCKKAKAKVSSTSTPSLLNVTFSFDSSSCNTKWIILGSVLGSVALILIILILIFTFNQKARECIRPFSRKRTAEKIGDE